MKQKCGSSRCVSFKGLVWWVLSDRSRAVARVNNRQSVFTEKQSRNLTVTSYKVSNVWNWQVLAHGPVWEHSFSPAQTGLVFQEDVRRTLWFLSESAKSMLFSHNLCNNPIFTTRFLVCFGQRELPQRAEEETVEICQKGNGRYSRDFTHNLK